MRKPTPVNRVLEVRYERGYRYLDHTGEAMLILQDLLPSETRSVWMPDEVTPTGARLKCPDLDLRIVFDSGRFIVEQISDEETSLFQSVATSAFSVISGRFDLRSIVRFGLRRWLLLGTDSTEQAEELSLKHSPSLEWPPFQPPNFRPRSMEVSATYEKEDGSEGYMIAMKPISKIDAPEQIDERAKLPARLLEKGQKEALLDQLKRRNQREKDPRTGVLIDIDYYQIRPAKPDISSFWTNAIEIGDKIIAAATVGR